MASYAGALLLDLDGTLVDTATDFVHSIGKLCLLENIEAPEDTLIRQTVSHGGDALTKLIYNIELNHPSFSEKRQQLLDIYGEFIGQNCDVFEGFNEVLAHCEKNNIAWGIVTNKPVRFAKPLIKQLGLKPTNDVLLCPEHVSEKKPHPESLFKAADMLGLKPEQCLYAGDHIRDIEAGNRANMPTIACHFGYISEADKPKTWPADYHVHHAQEITPIVQQYFTLAD